MQVAIVGAGAVGGLLGGLLARAGHAISFVAQGESVEAIRTRGIAVTTPIETFSTGPLRASSDPRDLGACDLVIVAVKAWQVEPLAPLLVPLVRPTTMVIPVQNGVEAAAQLAVALGKGSVIGGICHVLGTRTGPACVAHSGPAPTLTLGEREGGSSPRLSGLADLLRESGISVTLSPDIQAALWSKLLFVEPLGSVGAVTRSPAGVVRAIPETRDLLERAMLEVHAVAAGVGVTVPGDAIAQALARIDDMPAGATTSMHRDIVEGRPSELREQTGAVVRIGREASVPRPVHDFLFASLLPQDRGGRFS